MADFVAANPMIVVEECSANPETAAAAGRMRKNSRDSNSGAAAYTETALVEEERSPELVDVNAASAVDRTAGIQIAISYDVGGAAAGSRRPSAQSSASELVAAARACAPANRHWDRCLQRTLLSRTTSLPPSIRQRLEEADGCLQRGAYAEAVPSLEYALLGSKREPWLQSTVWRLLGNVHLSLGNYKNASVCYLHNLAFCRELSDLKGITGAECNLGIAYMKLGLLKLAGR